MHRKAYLVVGDSYGLSKYSSLYVCRKVGLNELSSSDQLTNEKWKAIIKILSVSRNIKEDLKQEIRQEILKHVKSRTLKGLCHIYGLPSNGQKTKTNGRTAKKLRLNISHYGS